MLTLAGIYDLQTESYFQNKAKSTTPLRSEAWKLLFPSLFERNKTANRFYSSVENVFWQHKGRTHKWCGFLCEHNTRSDFILIEVGLKSNINSICKLSNPSLHLAEIFTLQHVLLGFRRLVKSMVQETVHTHNVKSWQAQGGGIIGRYTLGCSTINNS